MLTSAVWTTAMIVFSERRQSQIQITLCFVLVPKNGRRRLVEQKGNKAMAMAHQLLFTSWAAEARISRPLVSKHSGRTVDCGLWFVVCGLWFVV